MFQLWCLFLGGIEDRNNVLVFRHQFCRSFFTNSRHTVQVVARITAQRCILRILRRCNASALNNSGLVIQRIITDAAFVVQHTNVWVSHQLICISVSGDNQQIFTSLLCLFGDGGDQIITFKTGGIYCGDAHYAEHLFDDVHLLIQDVWLRFALRFVLRRSFMSERLFFAIKHHNHPIGFVVLHQCQQHRAKSVNRISHLTTCRHHVSWQRKERSVCERVSIEDHQLHKQTAWIMPRR